MKINKNLVKVVNSISTFLCFISLYYLHQILGIGKQETFIIAATMAVFFNSFPVLTSVKAAITISFVILIMDYFEIHYPPAGAIALIPSISGEAIQDLGYWYVLYPTGTGLLIISIFAQLKKQVLWLVNKQWKL